MSSSAQPAVVRNDSVRYDRVTTGICRYHCSRVIGMAAEAEAAANAELLSLTRSLSSAAARLAYPKSQNAKLEGFEGCLVFLMI
mmetsp:Transcript_29395/g.72765  ORF Transcript_29395/g.72765 Transcript_29395/m.72765 type:complete len:84 (+) Transcript_29395:38-289(+)